MNEVRKFGIVKHNFKKGFSHGEFTASTFHMGKRRGRKVQIAGKGWVESDKLCKNQGHLLCNTYSKNKGGTIRKGGWYIPVFEFEEVGHNTEKQMARAFLKLEEEWKCEKCMERADKLIKGGK